MTNTTPTAVTAEDEAVAIQLARTAGATYARAAVASGAPLAPKGTQEVLGGEWDGCPNDFPDIYDVFADAVGRDYEQNNEADELLVLKTANAWEAAYAGIAG